MTHFGKITSYDSEKGTGMIAPETGGDALPFKRKDLQQEAQVPSIDERFGYDTSEVNGGDKRAINLQSQQSADPGAQEQQAQGQQV